MAAPLSFHRVDYPEPHRERTRKLLAAHPEAKELQGHLPGSALIVAGLVAFQLGAAWLLRDQPLWLVVVAAWFIGALADHALWVLIHEATHNLVFRGSAANSHEVDLPPAVGASWNGALAAPTLANIDADPDLKLVLNTAHSGYLSPMICLILHRPGFCGPPAGAATCATDFASLSAWIRRENAMRRSLLPILALSVLLISLFSSHFTRAGVQLSPDDPDFPVYLPLVSNRMGVQAPVLKWQRGGCTSWCETGWYSSPAVGDIDSDGQAEVISAAYSLFILNGATGAVERSIDPTGSRLWPGVVVADLEGNGSLEIVVALGGGYLHVYDQGGAHLAWSRQYTSVDNYRIQGWIIKPPGFDPKKKYPLMLTIHGGPHAMYNGAFNFGWQEHAASGYLVLYTNPRGGTGYGSAFGNAIKNAYPGKDYDDLMAGVDTVIGRGYVDDRNMFVYGCSGGGVLTAWIVGHTNRFTAASSNCPVINWLSFVGTTDGPSWYRNFEKLPWEDPSEHLRRSPLMYVGNVTTPTMLMTGVEDLRTPIPQTEEYYMALKMRQVPTVMVRLKDEWHA